LIAFIVDILSVCASG